MAKQTSPFSENQTQSTNKSRMKGLKRIVIFAMTLVLFFGITSNAEAVNYYSFTNGSPSTLALWWTATDGTGTHPANFTTVGDVFTIQSGNTMTTTANWTVAGTLVVNSGGVFAATSTGTTISLGALILFLIIRPQGIFGSK